MKVGMVGLGRMGRGMAARLARGGHECVVYNRGGHHVAELEKEGAIGAASLEELVTKLDAPRAVWVMLPAGEPTETAVQALAALLDEGDVIVDGGNTHHRDDVRRAADLAGRGLGYVDAGTSGGVWGLERGYCLMIGAEPGVFARLEPLFRTLAPGAGGVAPTAGLAPGGTAERGYVHCGPAGSGHFAKMVHNGIEYGLMQSYAEGLDILRSSDYEFDLPALCETWRRGSVIQSWLLDLTASALAEDPALERYEGRVQDSGEGRWTLEAAIDEAVPAGALAAALFARFRSRRERGFADQVLSAMREKFGGHVEPPRGG